MDLKLNISFNNPAPEPDRRSLVGAPITFGKDKRRWRIKSITARTTKEEVSPEKMEFFAFAAKKNSPESENSVRIIRFCINEFENGTDTGKEVGICLDKEKWILAWFPRSETPPELPIIEG